MIENKNIIKALRICSKSSWLNDCDGCPCYDEEENIQTSECQERLMKNALELIENYQAEIERLNALIAETNKQRGEVIHAITRIDEVKIKAYKELADMLNKEFSQCQREYRNVLNSDGACAMIIAKKVVDNILTELTERKEDGKNE